MNIVVCARRVESHRVTVGGHVRKLRLETAELERFDKGSRVQSANTSGLRILCKLLAAGVVSSIFLYLMTSSLIA